jgi:hypothetical protein
MDGVHERGQSRKAMASLVMLVSRKFLEKRVMPAFFENKQLP